MRSFPPSAGPALAFMPLALALALAGGCRANDASDAGVDAGTDAGPPQSIDDLPIDLELTFDGLDADVDIVRDVYGVPHVYATTMHDLGFANGYVHAIDRLPQMLLFRAFGSGKVAELGGALDATLIDDDIVMRYMGLARVAAEIDAGIDPTSESRVVLDAYAEGVNAHIARLQSFEEVLPAGVEFINVAYIAPWTPADTFTFGRLLSFNLAFRGDAEIELTALYQAMIATFDGADPVGSPDLAARAGLFADTSPFAPATSATIIPGVPNWPVDTGTSAAIALGAPRPWIAEPALDDALATLRRPFESRFNPFRNEDRGSNAWTVAGDRTDSGFPILANDFHLLLDNPSLPYEIHLDLARADPTQPSVVGIGFASAPGLVVGHNQWIAWGGTSARLDVDDVYRETVVDCPTGGTLNCVMFNGAPAPILTTPADIGIGVGGLVVSTITVPVETLPHRPGVIVPEVLAGAVVPRTTTEALSYRWTGFEPSNELGAFLALMHAHDVDEARTALDFIEVGASNWHIVTVDGDLFYSAQARLPIRAPAALTFSYPSLPTGSAPFLVLDGGGGFEWIGDMEDRYLPHAVSAPDGFISSANNDPVGATLDNDPLYGSPDATDFYYGWTWDIGFRDARVKECLGEELEGDGASDDCLGSNPGPGTLSFEEMQAIQADDLSAVGRRLSPHLLAAMAALEDHLDGTTPRLDLAAFATALPPATLTALRDATLRLAAWTYHTPDGVEIDTTPADVDESIATSIFARWLSRVLLATFDDEVAALGGRDFERPRALLYVVEQTASLLEALHPDTGDAIVFDDLTTPAELETRDLVFLRALADALDDLANTCCTAIDGAGFGTADMTEWRWGLLHTLRLHSLVPSLAAVNPLDNPRLDDPLYGLTGTVSFGFPRHGDIYGVDSNHYEPSSFDYTYFAGPVMRAVMEMDDQGMLRMENVLPGGTVFDSASPHFGDQMELWRRNVAHPVAYWENEVVAAAESRIVLRASP